MLIDLSLIGAFAAGLISFASPCVLPLTPAYLSFLGGVGYDRLTDSPGTPRATGAERRRLVVRAIAFVLGFSTIFVLLGASASAAGRLFSEWFEWLAVAAGATMIVLGLHVAGWLRLPMLMREARPEGPRATRGLAGAYAVGLAFGFGWTPCVGPILASILLLSGTTETIGRGMALLAAYSFGIGLPFILAAAFAPFVLAWLGGLRAWMKPLSVFAGLVLVATGALIATGRFGLIGAWMLETFPVFGRIG